jgi:4'-phosphopantetheinyl transferase
MAVTQGTPVQVVNIGLGIKQLKVEPKGAPVKVYLESLSHKVSHSYLLLGYLTHSVPANTG